MLSRRSLGLALLGTALVAGCSTTRVVDSQVQSWSTLTTPSAPPTYRLEKLPSQQASAKAFAPIEALAHTALQRAGLAPGAQVREVEAWVGQAGKKLAQYESERDDQRRGHEARRDAQRAGNEIVAPAAAVIAHRHQEAGDREEAVDRMLAQREACRIRPGFILDAGLEPLSLRAVITTSEKLTDAMRQKILDNPDRYILETTVLSEDDNAGAKQYTVAVKVSLNVANLRNDMKAGSAVGKATRSERSAAQMSTRANSAIRTRWPPQSLLVDCHSS